MSERFPTPISAVAGASALWQALLEQIFEDAPLPLTVLDSLGNVIRQNTAQLAFNLSVGALLGIGDYSALDDPRSITRGHAAHFRRALAFETVEYQLELEKTALGQLERLTFQRLLVPVGSIEGRPSAVLSVVIDTTERTRAEDEKERLNAQLLHTRKLESLGVLAGGIAHDFNNLLMGVMGNASIVRNKLERGSSLEPHVVAIEKAARRAADVAQQMLAYAGKGQVEKELLELSALVDDSADLLRLSVAGRVELRCELGRELPAVEADLTQIQQIVLNLVTNACEATEGNGGNVTLRTGAMDVDALYLIGCFHGSGVAPGRFVFLEVEDHGQGMDPSTLPRIFDPFFTTKFEGRGLGLAGVMGIVRGHQGAIRVESAPQLGTRFRVLLPAKLGVSAPVRSYVSSAESALVAAQTVLVIDDEELVRDTAVAMLSELGCQVLSAASGREGIAIYQRMHQQIGVVLLDLTMPELDGTSTLKELSALDPDVSVVLMSGYDPAQALAKVASGESTRFLRKPFTLVDLQKAVAGLAD
jgi:two-component system cell cycle sensor histidine kinase/response regulator CckA